MLKYNEAIAADKNLKTKKPKHIHKPTTQLSHDGIALISHLYAQKDHSPKQPIAVKTFEGFKKIVNLVAHSSNDVSLSLIIQFDEEYDSSHGEDNHRIAMKIEKRNLEIHIAFLDSIVDSHTKLFCILTLEKILKDTQIHLHHESQKNRRKRQNDLFQCTVFSIKDARQLNRNTLSEFLICANSTQDYTNKNSSNYTYTLPPTYLKGIQSRTYQKLSLKKSANEIVSRKGLTLEDVYSKHPDQSYIPHFSKKYEALVMTCANSLNDAELDAAINNYKAEEISVERFNSIYSNSNHLALKKA